MACASRAHSRMSLGPDSRHVGMMVQPVPLERMHERVSELDADSIVHLTAEEQSADREFPCASFGAECGFFLCLGPWRKSQTVCSPRLRSKRRVSPLSRAASHGGTRGRTRRSCSIGTRRADCQLSFGWSPTACRVAFDALSVECQCAWVSRVTMTSVSGRAGAGFLMDFLESH